MGLDDLGDPAAELAKMRKAIRRIHPVTGDSSHAGAGDNSIQLGSNSSATDSYGVAIGGYAWSNDDFGTALGPFCEATGQNTVAVGIDCTASANQSIAVGLNASAGNYRSTAIGRNTTTTADNQIMLGTSGDTVVVPGTFSNPSARRLKQNIEPAPALTGIFPDLFEWEYIADPGTRRIGPMADDLVGTDAERFVQFDADGQPIGINMIGLLVAQVAALNARITVLENDRRQDG